MDYVTKNLIEVIGVSDSFPDNPEYFAQVAIPETLVIPKEKPDMEQLLSIIVEPVIESVKLVETPLAISNEGQFLSGCKIVVELKLREKVKYVADEPTQTVHAAHFENVFKSIFIIVPCEINGIPIERLLQQNKVIVQPYIEDIYAEMTDERTIFKNITVFVNVKFRQCITNTIL